MALFHSFVLSALLVCSGAAEESGSSPFSTCQDLKTLYRDEACCGMPGKEIGFQVVPNPKKRFNGKNKCGGMAPKIPDLECLVDGVIKTLEQAGGDVTKGFVGGLNTGGRVPISKPFYQTALCPVNVHWHLGAEHRSKAEFDENGVSPKIGGLPDDDAPRRAAVAGEAPVRYGYACNKYNASDPRFTTEYKWQHCPGLHVGETYEVHWPHSTMGACGTPNQYQSPFPDGVFCNFDIMLNSTLPAAQVIASNVGVQGQVFTIINDEAYYYPDLIRGMIVDKDNNYGQDVASYTGSTTGTSRNNQICSGAAPITWQVDRKCHLISASSFDKMCADMKQMRDDMSQDMEPHGARELVWKNLTANNQEDVTSHHR